MNKTVNINLASTFFHIDEDAYLKLQRYLEAIKRSFTDSQGRTEIITDVEARIAELFNERLKSDRQVIGLKEVDEVISIMGQPEDYLIDDDIFEETPKTKKAKNNFATKKLFRDPDNSYVGGVSAGLGHYLGVDAIWIRITWLILLFGFGSGFFIYIILWIFVPKATTTAQKLNMTGDPVNISNIEKKINDGFDTVAGVAKNVSGSVVEAAKNTDLKKKASSIKTGTTSFFNALADIIQFIFKLIAKLIGVILIITGLTALITLIIGWFSIGVFDAVNFPFMDYVSIALMDNAPIWLVSLLVFLAIGIPFFFIFYLGLKILINHLKSIGKIAKFTLLGLWLCAIIALVIIGIKEASEHSSRERTTLKQELFIAASDTLNIKMSDNNFFGNNFYRSNSYKIITNESGEKTILGRDISILVKPTTDTTAYLTIEKSSKGRNYETAMQRAKNIQYAYAINNNVLLLDPYLTTATKNKFSGHEVHIIINAPIGTVIKFDENTKYFLHHLLESNDVNHFLKVTDQGVICEGCDEDDDTFEFNIDTPNVKINKDGIEIKTSKNTRSNESDSINEDTEDFKIKIDSMGINITTEP